MTRRLLFVVNVDSFFASHRLPIALAAAQAGYEVHLAAALTGQAAALARQGLVVHPLRLDRGAASPFAAIALLRDLVRLFRQLRPDLVHLVTIKPVLLGALAARWAGVPGVVAAVPGLGFVYTARGAVAALRRGLVNAGYRLALGHRNLRVILQNPDDLAVLRRLVAVPPERFALVRGSGVDLQAFRATPLPPGVPVVLMAARLLADKGVREYVQAATRLRGQGGGARFVLAGGVDLSNPSGLARSEVEDWVARGLVEWWGPCSDMPRVIAATHIVVLPSYREGLPKVLAEAAACGRPVVATDVPGCREAVIDGETGLLVPPRDAEALARAIARLLADAPLRARMGAAGRRLAESAFDVRQVVARHLAIYEQLAQGH